MSGKTRSFLLPAKPAKKSAEGGAPLDGRYRIVRLLGEGGMGAVYLASHVGLGRDVAIKFLHAEFISREDIVGRFRREAQAAAAIRHKNIIEVFDVGVSPQGEPFLVMEYLEGESLAGLLKRVGPLSLGAACAVMEPVLQALQAAHRKGVVHRDLKPDNIFLAYQEGEPPVVKIIDFGISKFTQGELDKWRTKTGAVMGTPAYMSPEQARGSAGLDHRTDLYSMGTILFEMLAGALPYAGTNFAEYLSAMLVDEPRAPQSVYADFPVEAEPIVLKALAKNPDQRFQSAAEMLDALTALPSYDAGKERLSLLASTLEVRGFAAGDLGQALSKPGRLTGDKAAPSRLRGASTALTRAGGWRWVVLAGALALLVGGVAVWLRNSTNAPLPTPLLASQPAPSLPVAPAPVPNPQPASPPTPQPTLPSEPAPVPRAEITLVTADRTDLDCMSRKGISGYNCGFSTEIINWQGEEQNKLKPYYTADRHLYLIPGLFLEPAIAKRFQSEPSNTPREQLKRFTASCQIKEIGILTGVRTRWLANTAWSNPEDIEVATISACKVVEHESWSGRHRRRDLAP